jgi:hypothetical protein
VSKHPRVRLTIKTMVQKSVCVGTLKRRAMPLCFAFGLSIRNETWNLIVLVLQSGRENEAGKEDGCREGGEGGVEVGNPYKRIELQQRSFWLSVHV